MKWTKGDPYPSDWPKWLREADIAWCDVEVDRGLVIWKEGTWKGGTWFEGTWENGIWEGGIWDSGTWEGGIWYTGVWESGTWQGGTWENGTWHTGVWFDGAWFEGTWKGGVWFDGAWYDGTWEYGTWKGGTWDTGTWNDGIWVGGTWREGTWLGPPPLVPRFGWFYDSGLYTLGEDGPKDTREGWEARLSELEPACVAEFKAMCLWVDLTRPKAPGPQGGPLWERLLEEDF